MTIEEAVSLADKLKPNQYDFETKVDWLSELDGMIFHEVMLTHENPPLLDFHGYEHAETCTALLVPFPYEEVYVAYIHSQIDRENGETPKYNQSATAFNEAYSRYANWYSRTHRTLPNQFRI